MFDRANAKEENNCKAEMMKPKIMWPINLILLSG